VRLLNIILSLSSAETENDVQQTLSSEINMPRFPMPRKTASNHIAVQNVIFAAEILL